jgi:dihydrofolate reductase
MTKLIMWNLITLDGCFEGTKSWDLDFHNQAWGHELERLSIDQLHAAGTLVFGRVTYQDMAAYWETAKGEIADLMNSMPKVIFSRTLERADWANTKLLKPNSAANLAAEVQSLKSAVKRDIFVFGSANLSATFIALGLYDEYRIALVPTVLGVGKPLFDASSKALKLKLLDTRALSNGWVILRYEPQRGE